MKKRLTAIAVSIAVVFASQSALASGFTDLTEFHEWAAPQIEEMTTLGIIKGYTDGSFRPDRAITKTESLVLIARAAGYVAEGYDTFKAAASERYAEIVSPYNTLYPNEVSFLLYKGILSEDELGTYISSDRADSPLLRYEMAELLTRLMRAENSVNKAGEVTLTYSDSGEIPYSAAPFVEYVTNTSLMNGVYDPEYPNETFFKPYGSVTRAQMAVLLHRVLDKMDIKVTTKTLLGKNASANTITFRDDSDSTVIYRITDDMNLYIDGYKAEDLTHAFPGATVCFFNINSTTVDIEIVNTAKNKWDGETESDSPIPSEPVEGKISTIILSDECSIIVDSVTYPISAGAAIYVNHVAGTVYDLRVGYNAELEFSNGKVIMIYATSSAQADKNALTAEGVITKLNVTNRSVYLLVTNSETGVASEKQLYIETGAAIFNAISGESLDFLDLEADDNITATGTLKDGNFYASKIIVR